VYFTSLWHRTQSGVAEQYSGFLLICLLSNLVYGCIFIRVGLDIRGRILTITGYPVPGHFLGLSGQIFDYFERKFKVSHQLFFCPFTFYLKKRHIKEKSIYWHFFHISSLGEVLDIRPPPYIRIRKFICWYIRFPTISGPTLVFTVWVGYNYSCI